MAHKPRKSTKIPSGIDQHGNSWRVRISRKGIKVLQLFHDFDDAVRFRDQTLADIKGNKYKDLTREKQLLLVDIIQRYMDEETPKKAGRRTESNMLKAWQKVSWAKLPIVSIRSSHIVEWRKQQEAKGLAPTSISNPMNCLSKVFRTAKSEWSLDVENPVAGVARPKKRRPRHTIPDNDLEDLLITKAKGSKRVWLSYFIRIAAWSALREGEIRHLKWSDINFDNHLIQVRAEDIGAKKNSEARFVAMLDPVVAALREWEALRPKNAGNDGWVFPSIRDPGRVMSMNTISCGFHNLMTEVHDEAPADRKPIPITFHDLRHWGVTRMAPFHFGDTDLSRTTGHKTPQVLRGYYNPDPKERAKRIRELAKKDKASQKNS